MNHDSVILVEKLALPALVCLVTTTNYGDNSVLDIHA